MERHQKIHLLYTALLLLFMVACEKKGEDLPDNGSGTKISFEATEDTGTAFDDDGYTLLWSGEEQTGVYYATTASGSNVTQYSNMPYTVSKRSEDMKRATFTGDIEWVDQSGHTHKFYVYYPYSKANDAAESSQVKGVLSATQAYDTKKPSDISAYDFLYCGTTQTTEIDINPTIKLKQLFSVLRLNFTNATSETIEIASVKLSSESELILAGEFQVNLGKSNTAESIRNTTEQSGADGYFTRPSSSITTTVSNGILVQNGTLDVRLMINAGMKADAAQAYYLSGETLKVEVTTTANKVWSREFTARDIARGVSIEEKLTINSLTDPGVTPPTDEASYVCCAAELAALGTLSAGEVVIWRNGTYDAQVLTLSGEGTTASAVVFRAESPGGVIFTGASKLEIQGSYIEVRDFWWKDPTPSGEHLIKFAQGSSHNLLKNCAVTGYNSAYNATVGTKWVSLYGSNHTVTECTFDDKRNMGALCVVWVENGIKPQHTISNNYFSRPEIILDATNEPANEQETIRIGDSSSSMQDAGCVIEKNHFYRCNGEAQEIVSNKTCGNRYSENLFFESKGTLTMRHGNNCTVSGNYFLGNDIVDTGGVRIIGEGHTVEDNYFERLNSVGYKAALCLVRGQADAALSGYWQVKNAVIRNNTFVDCALAIHANYGSGTTMLLPVISTTMENNLIVAPDAETLGYAVRYETSTPEAEIAWTNNTIYGRFKNNHFGLTAVKTRPSVPDVTSSVTAIRNGAGITWSLGK